MKFHNVTKNQRHAIKRAWKLVPWGRKADIVKNSMVSMVFYHNVMKGKKRVERAKFEAVVHALGIADILNDGADTHTVGEVKQSGGTATPTSPFLSVAKN
jgi:hypothetical protein